MTNCFNIQSTTVDWIKRDKETVLEFVVGNSELNQDLIW